MSFRSTRCFTRHAASGQKQKTRSRRLQRCVECAVSLSVCIRHRRFAPGNARARIVCNISNVCTSAWPKRQRRRRVCSWNVLLWNMCVLLEFYTSIWDLSPCGALEVLALYGTLWNTLLLCCSESDRNRLAQKFRLTKAFAKNRFIYAALARARRSVAAACARLRATAPGAQVVVVAMRRRDRAK